MRDRIEGYYDHFPPKHMNVSVSQMTIDAGNGQFTRKNILVVNKDIKEGEEIYLEEAVVATLDADLESTESYCSNCLRKIDSAISLSILGDPLRTVYCSKACQTKAFTESHSLLFGLDPPFSNDPAHVPISEEAKWSRKHAQEMFVTSLRKNGKVTPLLVAKFVGRQVSTEMARIGVNRAGASPITGGGAMDGEYSHYDHVERLRYLEIPSQLEESKLIANVLEVAMSGLEQFIHEERYAILKGKMAYNAIGICYASGRNDKPAAGDKPEDVEKTRTPYGTDHQIGCGLYPVSSYIAHSCRPSVRPTFPDGTSSLHLIANHSLKKGDELTMAYVDVLQHPDEPVHEARLRRRKELVRGWRFACMCPRCVEEGPQSGPAEEKTTDESKIEIVYSRYDDDRLRQQGEGR